MRPLTHWRIRAARLPERLTEDTLFDASFRLPGADALSAFADLLGGAPDEDCGSAPDMQEVDFTLPAAIPADVSGTVELAVELDFGTLCADDAELTLELVRGKGRVLADDMPLCAFQNPKDGFLRVPLTRALHAGRKQTIRLCFDASRPAGVLGPVNLRLTTRARLRDVVLLPDAAARIVRLRATLAAMETGRYVLRARTACKGDVLPMHDLPVSLTAGEPQTVEMTLPLPANPFMAGRAADGPSLRVQLFTQGRHGALCDETTLLCGFGGQPASYDMPLLPSECLDPDALLARIGRMRLFGVRLDAPAPECFYRTMTLAGVSVLHPFATEAMRERLARHACVSFGDAPLARMRNLPALDAWLLCGLTACPRTPPADTTPAELLFEAAGRERKVRTSPPCCCGSALSACGCWPKPRGKTAFRARSARPASGRTRMFSPPCKPRLRRRTSALCPCAARGSRAPNSAQAFTRSSMNAMRATTSLSAPGLRTTTANASRRSSAPVRRAAGKSAF